MKISLHILLGVTLLFTLASCNSDSQTKQDDITRPYEPWVSRSVLDEQPRMITLALHDDLWAAYSTQGCSMYKVWKGYVNFEGAVFNTAHGPQPVTVGDAYTVNVFDNPWKITKGGKELNTLASYDGHRLVDGHAQLMYTLTAEGVEPIHIYEEVEFAESDGGQIGLSRTFTTSNVAEGAGVLMQTNINSIVARSNIQTDGTLVVYEEEKKEFEQRQLIEIEGHLELKNNEKTNFTVFFVSTPTIPNDYKSSEGDEEDQPLGYRLIARNDCKTCHNTNVKTIGPSYTEIAEKYSSTEETVSMLVNKILKGGAGIWGIQAMSPHPELPESDARAMVEWILDLDQDDQGAPGESPANAITLEPSEVNEKTLIPGAITKVYMSKSNLGPNLAAEPSRKPDMAGIMPDFGNMGTEDFTDLMDNFAIYATGYLYFETAGTYVMRLWSDDGSKLWINDELIVDHDGFHGTSRKEASIVVEKGYYPFRLEYFQGTGGRFLSLNCKLPDQSEYITMPSTMFFHDAGGRSDLAGYSLPMSVSNRMPGDKLALVAMHPSYDLFQARPHDFLPKVGGMDVTGDGKLAICTWDATGSVYLIENPDAESPSEIRVKKIADGLAEPLGLKVVGDDIYILQKQELTRLVDTDGDDMIDEFQTVSNHWRTSANFHEFAFGLEYRDGFFYANLATAIQPGGASTDPQIEDRGKVMKINAETGEIDFIAHGLRTPNGIGFGVDGELFVSDNQGDWLPSSKILHVNDGAWFGSRSVDFDGTEGLKEQLPLVWLPQDEIGNSPSTPMLIEHGPYKGQMMHGEVTHGGIKRVFVEEVNGEYQGAVFRFIQGLEAGVNRMTYGEDGSLYVGGIGNPGNWAQSGKLWYGLQRVKHNDKTTFEMLAVRARTNGIEIEFTEPLGGNDGWLKSDFEIRQWQYIPTIEYGGPKVNDQALRILSTNVSDDRTKVFLELEGMEEDRVVYVHLLKHFVSEMGNQLWSTEAWYTMNHIPTSTPGAKSTPSDPLGNNILTAAEQTQGFELLFDGKTLNGWKRFNNDEIGRSWIISDEAIMLDAKQDANGGWTVEDRGDLITEGEYENFELSLDWKISNCGNSGIMFSVLETADYHSTWQTGPEVQVLDNTCHPDGRYETHRANDLYDMIASSNEVVKPAGQWNTVRLIKKDGKVEHWLNGIKVVEYEMYNDAWDKMVAASKFADMPDFGKARKGHIAIQDHGDAQVWYRNIKIREL